MNTSANIYKEVEKAAASREDLPEISFKIPGKLKQFGVFIKRDILKKLSDTQYLVFNFAEAPVLALLLAGIVRYFDLDVSNKFGYTLVREYKSAGLYFHVGHRSHFYGTDR